MEATRRPEADEVEKVEMGEKTEKIEKAEKIEKIEKIEKPENPEKEKVVSLFEYIRELNQLKYRVVTDYRDHLWHCELSSLPDDPEHIFVSYRDRVEEDSPEAAADHPEVEPLLRVRKPTLQRCPEPDTVFANWLMPGWDAYTQTVSLYETLPGCTVTEKVLRETPPAQTEVPEAGETPENEPENEPEAETETVLAVPPEAVPEEELYEEIVRPEVFGDKPERVASYERWLAERDEWSHRQTIYAATLELFNKLFQLHFELQRESETEELIVTDGFLCSAERSEVRHPVLTHRVRLEFNADTNEVSILDTDSESELYTAMLQDVPDLNKAALKEFNTELEQYDYHPLDRNETPGYLRRLVHTLTADSTFSDEGIPPQWTARCRLLMYRNPCYILRKRLDGTLKAIEQIIEHVKEDGEVPGPIHDLVSGGHVAVPEDDGEVSVEEQLAAVGGESVDILLTKEANKEQLEIAHRIEQYNAVLVQGPPGTGKTHTIANLLGHFLAQGKSVLVTSHTTKALSVLKEKVEPGLQNLCVSMIGDSNVDMEKSVDGITRYMADTNSHALKNEMDRLAVERNDIIRQLAETRKRIFEIIHSECSSIVLNGESISPSAAARFIVEHADTLSYIPGKVHTGCPLPLSFDALNELYRSNELVTEADEAELAHNLPDPATLITPSDYEDTRRLLLEARAQVEKLRADTGWTVENNAGDLTIDFVTKEGSFTLPYPDYGDLAALQAILDRQSAVEGWMLAVATDGKLGGESKNRWQKLTELISYVSACAEQVMADQLENDVCFADGAKPEELQPLYETLRDLFEQGKKIGFFTANKKELNGALAQVTVNGKTPSTAADCALVLAELELRLARKRCAKYWNTLLSPHGVPGFEQLDPMAPERVAANWVDQIGIYLDWYDTSYQPLLAAMQKLEIPTEVVFAESKLDAPLAATEKILRAAAVTLPAICAACNAILKEADYAAELEQTRDILQAGDHAGSSVCEALLAAVDSGDATRYLAEFGRFSALYAKYSLQSKRNEYLKTLGSYAPQWAEAIRTREGIHGAAAVPDTIEEAWRWKQLSAIIDELTEKPFAQLQADSLTLSKRYRELTAEYAEKSGWYHLLVRTESDLDMKQALQGWKLAVRKIGKGTGKRAPEYRAVARAKMAQCQQAVPCWIMTINKALESLNPKENRFDIIIIDEASQSDISSLAILYMGKKLIIVGDDKQVSPMAIGTKTLVVKELQEKYITGRINNAFMYDGETSIYDIAATTFQPLMLREHFRCVPEIIGFSNMLSYDGKIKPLRDAGSSGLLPAVVNYRVPEGKRDDYGKTNPAEARTIVALMRACMAQPEYDGKSFGVISLLGDDQFKLIQREIERQLSPKEIVGRNILCGNSANFQGDERDVVFLSLVDSGTGEGPLTKVEFGVRDATRKRYNVAASRAKDQLWVVNSLDPANDLQPGDLRKRLIEYAINPNAYALREEAIEAKAESPFEAAVAQALSDRGYHIQQQRRVGAYRLDMVAVCGRETVAIECDGERWHSGEAAVREDMERQTILARLGWRFIRIRGSEYYRNPEHTLARVMAELATYGIVPETVDVAEATDTRNTELLRRVLLDAERLLNEENTENEENEDNPESPEAPDSAEGSGRTKSEKPEKPEESEKPGETDADSVSTSGLLVPVSSATETPSPIRLFGTDNEDYLFQPRLSTDPLTADDHAE